MAAWDKGFGIPRKVRFPWGKPNLAWAPLTELPERLTLKNVSIARKLPITLLILTLATAGLIGVLSYGQIRDTMEGEALKKLVAMEDLVSRGFGHITEDILTDLDMIVESVSAPDGMKQFAEALEYINRASGSAGEELRLVFGENPSPDAKTYTVDQSDYIASFGHKLYVEAHTRWQPWFNFVIEDHKYLDAYLINDDGVVVYSAHKSGDFAADLGSSSWRDTPLAKVVERAVRADNLQEYAFSDFVRDTPDGGQLIGYIAHPIETQADGRIGTLVLKISPDPFNENIGYDSGLGVHVQSYAVGDDLKIRFSSGLREDAYLDGDVSDHNTDMLMQAFGGNVIAGVNAEDGEDHLEVYGMTEIFGVEYVLGWDVEYDAIMGPTNILARNIIIIVVICAIGLAAIATVFVRFIVKPLQVYLLAKDTDTQDRLPAEISECWGDEAPSFQSVNKLGFTKNVFREAMRLYPPVPGMIRSNLKEEHFRDRVLRKGSQVLLSPWHLHRHTRLWDSPDSFDPDRWGTENGKKCLREAYIPFSAGPRVCTGSAFAIVEGVLLLAMLVRAFRFELVDGREPIPVAHLTLRAKDGINLRVTPIRITKTAKGDADG